MPHERLVLCKRFLAPAAWQNGCHSSCDPSHSQFFGGSCLRLDSLQILIARSASCRATTVYIQIALLSVERPGQTLVMPAVARISAHSLAVHPRLFGPAFARLVNVVFNCIMQVQHASVLIGMVSFGRKRGRRPTATSEAHLDVSCWGRRV